MINIRMSFVGLGVLFIAHSCANKVSLTGGEKDENPPKILQAVPLNKSIDFNAKEITLEFDEIIQIKNSSQIMISPLIDEKIKYQVTGKSLKVKLPNNLKDSTTYTINFNESIVDNNESNPLLDYSYVFSTYSSIDTGVVSGKCIDAQSKNSLEDVLVGLYKKKSFLIDSLKPSYIAKTSESGDFYLNGIRSGQYFIRAIKDDNRDYKLQNTELFGFITGANHIDSFIDSVTIELSSNRNIRATYDVFTNEFSYPVIVLSKPCERIDLIGVGSENVEYSLNRSRDTITVLSQVRDTSVLLFLSNKTDTVFVPDITKSKDEKKLVSLSIKSEKVRGKKATIVCNSRIDSFNKSKVHLFKDSIELLIDSVVLGFRNNIHVYFKKSEDLISARIQIDSAAVYNESFCNNVFNSPIDYVHPDDLGIAEFIIEGSYKGSVIAILEDKAGEVMGYKSLDAGVTSFQFNKLYQGEYYLRIIQDENSNKVWDSADFENMIPAEKIVISGPYRLEQGWDLLGNKIQLN